MSVRLKSLRKRKIENTNDDKPKRTVKTVEELSLDDLERVAGGRALMQHN